MGEVKMRYSAEELKEFEELILDKLEKANKELTFITDTLSKKNSTDTDATNTTVKVLEGGAATAEKQNMIQLASRQAKFIENLKNALIRIKNGSYGVCIDTGKLIGKERLKAVPHTRHSIEAKLKNN